MIFSKLTRKPSLVLACFLLFTLVALPVQGISQGVLKDTQEGVEKAGEEVKEGAETVGEKTKEGAEAVGEEVEDVFTDDDKDKNQDDKIQREKPADTEPSSETAAPSRTGSSESSKSSTSEDKDLPATAGELPILLLTGLAFLGAGVTRVLRSK